MVQPTGDKANRLLTSCTENAAQDKAQAAAIRMEATMAKAKVDPHEPQVPTIDRYCEHLANFLDIFNQKRSGVVTIFASGVDFPAPR